MLTFMLASFFKDPSQKRTILAFNPHVPFILKHISTLNLVLFIANSFVCPLGVCAMHRVASAGNTGNSVRPRKEKRLTYVLNDAYDTKVRLRFQYLLVLLILIIIF